jgi:hypothetical protein
LAWYYHEGGYKKRGKKKLNMAELRALWRKWNNRKWSLCKVRGIIKGHNAPPPYKIHKWNIIKSKMEVLKNVWTFCI